jgi:putative ABC transport system permease protein
MKAILPLTGRIAGMLGRMAPRDLVNSLSRTSVAVAALMVSVAVTVGVSLMIASFRTTVVTWLEQTLQGDVYISVPSVSATTPSAPIDGEAIAALSVWPGVKRADLLNQATVNSPYGPVIVSATNNRQTGQERFYKTRMGSNQETWRLLEQGGVIVSEPLANRLNLPASGAVISLETPQGPRDFPVLGIYFDYTSSQGALIMALDVYQDLWKDPRVTAVSIRLQDGYDPEIVARELQDELTGVQQLDIRSNQGLRADVMEVFDRTFAITGALQILATVVAFIGVLNSLLLLQLEKQREIGILRSIGLTGRQLWGLVMLETGLMGLTAGLLAIPTGYVLSLILVYIINLRSFGWTLQLATTPAPFLQALGVALLAAVLAGLYPARRLSRMQAAEAVRYE